MQMESTPLKRNVSKSVPGSLPPHLADTDPSVGPGYQPFCFRNSVTCAVWCRPCHAYKNSSQSTVRTP